MILKPIFEYFGEREVRKKIVTFNGPGPLGLASLAALYQETSLFSQDVRITY